MPRHLLTATLGILLAGTVAFSAAQQSATLTLRSGATVSGQLVDLGGSGFTFRVNGEDRNIPAGDVASIDFGPDTTAVPDDARTLPGGTHLLVLRNGDVVAGEFYDVGGTNPLRITFRTATGERNFSANDVRRIYMTRVSDAPGAAVAAAGRGAVGGVGRTVNVSARTQWTATGITVRQGQLVRFDSSGEVRINSQNVMAAPAGNSENLFDARAPVPSVLQGALIARIGATGRGAGGGQVFAIGNQTSVSMPASGSLFLGINDSSLNDNNGQFTVVIIAPQ